MGVYIYIYIYTSDNTCSFSDTVPASLHSHLWFEGFGYRHIRYRIAVSTWEALEPETFEEKDLGVGCYCETYG